MKNLLIALILAAGSPLQAKIITVSNMPFSPGEYTSLTDALGVAFIDDTIYVHGSTFNYGAVLINRPWVTIIGTGHNPQKQFPFVSAFTTIDVFSDHVQLVGLVAERVTLFSPHFIMKRCMLLGSGGDSFHSATGSLQNLLLESNVFTSSVFNRNVRINYNAGDVISIRNNVFSSFIEAFGGGIPSLFEIVNNLFLHGPNAFSSIDRATINNNIFYGSSPFVPNFSTITMNNNISFQCGNDFFTTGPFITQFNNLEGVDPMLVDYPGPDDVFSYSHDYHLAPGSPALLSGSDGSDRGLYGGFGTIFNMEGEPPIAEVTSVNITSPTTVPPGGTLNVTVTTRRVH